MNTVTDLAARAVSFITLIQDTFLKGAAPPAESANMVLNDMFCTGFRTKLENYIKEEKERTSHWDKDGLTRFERRAIELVWISTKDPKETYKKDANKAKEDSEDPIKTGVDAAVAYTIELLTGLSGWICRHRAIIFGKLKACSTLPTPFAWREAISQVLYTHTPECLELATTLQYLPVQVILALGGGTYGARQQRMLQLWQVSKPDEAFLLTLKERKERDRLCKKIDIGSKKEEVATILKDDKELLERLRKDSPLSFELVFRAELEEIKASRQQRRQEDNQAGAVPRRREEDKEGSKAWAERQQAMASADPFANAKALELYALAFSGGGIRSATFNLGMLQGLARRGLIGRFDYLSTVSGGGYIGSWLAAWIKRDGSVTKVSDRLNPDKSPDPFGEEVAPIRWLRMFSNYFSPQASIMSVDAWTVGVTWLRNTLLNQVIILLIFLSALLSIRVFFEIWVHNRIWTQSVSGVQLYVSGAIMLLTAALLAGLGMQAYHSERLSPLPIKREKTAGISRIVAAIAFIGAFVVSAAFFSQMGYTQRPFSVASYAQKLGHLAPAFWLILLALLIVAALGRYISCIIAYGKTTLRALSIVGFTAAVSAIIATLCLALGWELMYYIRHIADLKMAAENAITVRKLNDLQALIAQKQVAIQRGLVTAQEFAAMKGLIAQKGMAALDQLNSMKAFAAIKELSAAKDLAALQDLAATKPGFGSAFYNGLAFTIGIPVVLLAFGITVVVRMALLGRYFPDERREWWGRMGASINRSAFIFMLLAGSSLLGMELARMAVSTSHSWWTGPATVGGWMALVGATVKAAFSAKTSGKGAGKDSGASSASSLLLDVLSKTGPYLFALGLLIFLPALLIPLFTHPIFRYPPIDRNLLLKTVLLTLAAAIPAYFLARRVGVNEFSMHHFYRNRLVRAYLGATRRRAERARTSNPFTNFDMKDDVKLSELKNDQGYCGPYPILNTALNASEASSLDRQDRKAESFVFSPLYCGFDFSMTRDSADAASKSYDYGYRPTEQFAYANDRGPGIGTAMAISGAAVNPNQGYHSSAATAFLLTVFNVQMGWWIGNPRKNKWTLADPESGLGYIISNLTGQTSTREDFVCLSDGGHFDNMGLYELVRRRCTFIVLGDSEQDNRFTCEGLANAIRRCRIDFGAEIDIDVAEITNRDEQNFSKKNYAIGKIWFAGDNEPTGVLLYIKSSIMGNEPVDVREYALKHDTFPHQTTADQFFDEEQFESYRQLGLHIADAALSDPDVIKALCLTLPPEEPTGVLKHTLHKRANTGMSFFKRIKLFLGWE